MQVVGYFFNQNHMPNSPIPAFDGTDPDLVQQAPSAHLALPPFQMISNSPKAKNSAKDRNSV